MNSGSSTMACRMLMPRLVVLHTSEPTSLGDDGYIVLTHWEADGMPVLGAAQRQLVSVGAAVLMVSESGEYESRSDAEREWIDELSELTRSLVGDLLSH
jgi:hypothetical protein